MCYPYKNPRASINYSIFTVEFLDSGKINYNCAFWYLVIYTSCHIRRYLRIPTSCFAWNAAVHLSFNLASRTKTWMLDAIISELTHPTCRHTLVQEIIQRHRYLVWKNKIKTCITHKAGTLWPTTILHHFVSDFYIKNIGEDGPIYCPFIPPDEFMPVRSL